MALSHAFVLGGCFEEEDHASNSILVPSPVVTGISHGSRRFEGTINLLILIDLLEKLAIKFENYE